MARLVVVSNRVALPRGRTASTGGLAVALRAALQKQGGLWMGWSGHTRHESSTEPELVEHGKVTYATFDLGSADHEAFYVQHANSALWPLCHYRTGMLEFSREALEGYYRVNRMVARQLMPLLRPDDLIWVHDYHFFPLAAELRALGVKNRIGFFLHIPFPVAEVLRALPDYERLLQELAQYDLVGLQTSHDLEALKGAMQTELGATLKGEVIEIDGRPFQARAFPIGIDTAELAKLAVSRVTAAGVQRLADSLGGRALVVGADRLDYSKGIGNRLQAFSKLLEHRPQHRGNVTFLQLAPISRDEVRSYRTLRRDLEAQVGRINGKFSEVDWTPIRWVNRGAPRADLAAICRLSKVGFVTPLRDGMNLVAKEYVAAQNPADPGVLVLSKFAGAAEELQGALLVNPYDADGTADALDRALNMPLEERIARWEPMMRHLEQYTTARWCKDFVEMLAA